MAISISNLTSGDSGSGSSYNTASITPSSNVLTILSVYNRYTSGTANTPTASGNGLTWTQIATYAPGGGDQRLTMFRAVGASPSTGAITIDFGGQTQDVGCAWSVNSVSGADITGTNGSNGVVQSATNVNTSANTGLTVTLAALAASTSAVLGMVRAGNAVTPGSGFTELSETTTITKIQNEWSTNDTTVDWSWSSTTAFAIGLAIELRASSSSPSSSPSASASSSPSASASNSPSSSPSASASNSPSTSASSSPSDSPSSSPSDSPSSSNSASPSNSPSASPSASLSNSPSFSVSASPSGIADTLADGLIAYWKLDESSGDAADATGNGYTASNSNVTYTTGKLNNAGAFNGTTSKFTITDAAALKPSDFSISAWVYNNDTTNSKAIFSSRNNTNGQGIVLYKVSSNILRLIINGDTFDTVATIGTSSWIHVAATYNSSVVKLYINGVERSSTAHSTDPTYSATNYVRIGVNGSATDVQYWNGNIDEVGFWNRGLSAQEVDLLYNNSLGFGYPFYTASNSASPSSSPSNSASASPSSSPSNSPSASASDSPSSSPSNSPSDSASSSPSNSPSSSASNSPSASASSSPSASPSNSPSSSASLSNSPSASSSPEDQNVVTFGIIADAHHEDIADDAPSYFRSVILTDPSKMDSFVTSMDAFDPDFVIQLGDFINNSGLTWNPTDFAEIKAEFERVNCQRRYHVCGNHDAIFATDRDDWVSLTGMSGTSYSFDIRNLHVVVLNTLCDSAGNEQNYYTDGTYTTTNSMYAGTSNRNWLEADLAASGKKTVVFTHYKISTTNALASSFGAHDSEEIRTILENSKNVIACFNGHVNAGTDTLVNGIHYYDLKSFVHGALPKANHAKVTVNCSTGDYTITGVDDQASYSVTGDFSASASPSSSASSSPSNSPSSSASSSPSSSASNSPSNSPSSSASNSPSSSASNSPSNSPSSSASNSPSSSVSSSPSNSPSSSASNSPSASTSSSPSSSPSSAAVWSYVTKNNASWVFEDRH